MLLPSFLPSVVPYGLSLTNVPSLPSSPYGQERLRYSLRTDGQGGRGGGATWIYTTILNYLFNSFPFKNFSIISIPIHNLILHILYYIFILIIHFLTYFINNYFKFFIILISIFF